MTVTYGNRTFPKARAHEWADDRPDLIVASYPVMLRFIARQLSEKGCWLAVPIDDVARDWNFDAEGNAEKLREVLAHDDLLTPAHVSRIRAALKKLQERNSDNV